MKKLLALIWMLAPLANCGAAGIPYLVNSNGIATNATFVGTGGNSALTVNDANQYGVTEIVVNPNINTLAELQINSLTANSPAFVVDNQWVVTANVMQSGALAAALGTPAWSIAGAAGGGSFWDNQLIVSDGNGDLSLQSISAAYASSFDGGGITTSGNGDLSAVTLNPTLGNSGTFNNTFLGPSCGNSTVSGCCNVGFGDSAFIVLQSGTRNVAVGNGAADVLTTGSFNVALGDTAFGSGNGSSNVCVGANAGSAFSGTESFNIDIGHLGVLGDMQQIRIGTPGVQTNCTIAGVINGNGGGLTNVTASSPTNFTQSAQLLVAGTVHTNLTGHRGVYVVSFDCGVAASSACALNFSNFTQNIAQTVWSCSGLAGIGFTETNTVTMPVNAGDKFLFYSGVFLGE